MADRDGLFGANLLRLSPRQWIVTLLLSAVVLGVVPGAWYRAEGIRPVADYRLPYAVSKDYALYEQHLQAAATDPAAVFVVGDSVIWGEYVRRDGTLSHFLSAEDPAHRYVNAGINGLFPLALEGLVTYYGGAMTNRKVLLHCNLLWMSSPEADLSTEKERVFNHVELVPQFLVDIPCYQADLTERTAIAARRLLPYMRWVRHLQVSNFAGASIPDWTLRDDGKYPPTYPHTYTNPLAAIHLRVPAEAEADSQRGPDSERHQPWSQSGRGPQRFDWVPLAESLQWSAFQRLTQVLTARGNDVLVVVGPFNEHMISDENQPRYQSTKSEARAWFAEQRLPAVYPAILPSELYGDASHPLTNGYRWLAAQLAGEPEFIQWLGR